jgi:DNA replication licensing factor MCM5
MLLPFSYNPQSHSSGSKNNDNQAVIPITVRQLEALVRLSESLAKMRLDSQVQSEDVAEALRLFRVSTMAANAAESSGATAHVGGGEEMDHSERFLRARLAIGTIVNKQRLVEEASAQGYNAMLVAKAIVIMAMRGEVQERNQGRLIKRIK